MSLRGTSASICFAMPLRHGAHCQEYLRCSAPASSISATAAPSASSIFPMALRHGAPASHKPHSAEKSTPVWLALWRIWAGFANSQLRCANFPALIYIYASIHIATPLKPLLRHSKSFGPSAPIAYATSVSPPNEAVAWPGRRYSIGDKAVA